MIKRFQIHSVESEMKELIFLIENINESQDSSLIKRKIFEFVKNACKLAWENAKVILKAFFEVIHWNSYFATLFYSALIIYGGLEMRLIIDNFTKNQHHINLVRKASLDADEHSHRIWGDGKVEFIDKQKGNEVVNKKEVEKEKDDVLDFLDLVSDEEEMEPEIDNEDLKKEKIRLSKKYNLVKPEGTNMKFDAKKTVFLSSAFPFEINYNKKIDYNLKSQRQSLLRNRYLKELEKVAKNKTTGLKLLATAMAYMEGYVKGSKSVATNNPGNIGNVDSGDITAHPTLKRGIEYQIDYLESVAYGIPSKFKGSEYMKYYPIGKVITRIPRFSKELRKVTPGFVFVYNGTLEEFLKIYATGPRINNDYLNVILSFFNTYFPGQVTPKTKIIDIINLGEVESIEDLIKNTP